MIILQEGQQYSLSTEDNSNKSLYFVKLTDSALQSIEMFLKSEENSSKPTIQFQNNSGTISLPLNGQKHNYSFTLSNIEGGGLQSSFHCIQHNGDRSLESIGSMVIKMQIHAKDDSYQQTKFKMAAADQEQKSFCTKEIKQNGTRLGCKLKVQRPGLVLAAQKSHLAIQKPEPAKLSLKNELTLMETPIRERIIHILAVKPYKKPELLLRLMNEGIHKKDKNNFTKVLNDVGTPKGNMFSLSNHLWNEVQENWKFCSKEELQLIQRRKQQFLKSNSRTEISSSITSNGFAWQNGISSEPAVPSSKALNKKLKTFHNGSKHNNEAPRNELSVVNSASKTNVPPVGNKPKFLYSQFVRAECNGTGKTNSAISCKQGSSQNHIAEPMETSATDNGMSSTRKLSVFQKFVKETNHRNSWNICQEVVNNNVADKHQSGISSLPSSNLVSKEAGHGANSYCEVKEAKTYNHMKTNNNIFVNGQSSPRKLTVLEKSNSYSSVFHGNSSLSSYKKDGNALETCLC